MDKVLAKYKEQILEAEETDDYSKIDSQLCEKRLNWLKEHINDVKGVSDVRKAYELLLIRKMEINPNDVPIVYEDKMKIVWQSSNWCPVLEICKDLGLDSRKVCKSGYENSVQEFVKAINPNLKFSRDYKNLRPYGKYCVETIELLN